MATIKAGRDNKKLKPIMTPAAIGEEAEDKGKQPETGIGEDAKTEKAEAVQDVQNDKGGRKQENPQSIQALWNEISKTLKAQDNGPWKGARQQAGIPQWSRYPRGETWLDQKKKEIMRKIEKANLEAGKSEWASADKGEGAPKPEGMSAEAVTAPEPEGMSAEAVTAPKPEGMSAEAATAPEPKEETGMVKDGAGDLLKTGKSLAQWEEENPDLNKAIQRAIQVEGRMERGERVQTDLKEWYEEFQEVYGSVGGAVKAAKEKGPADRTPEEKEEIKRLQEMYLQNLERGTYLWEIPQWQGLIGKYPEEFQGLSLPDTEKEYEEYIRNAQKMKAKGRELVGPQGEVLELYEQAQREGKEPYQVYSDYITEMVMNHQQEMKEAREQAEQEEQWALEAYIQADTLKRIADRQVMELWQRLEAGETGAREAYAKAVETQNELEAALEEAKAKYEEKKEQRGQAQGEETGGSSFVKWIDDIYEKGNSGIGLSRVVGEAIYQGMGRVVQAEWDGIKFVTDIYFSMMGEIGKLFGIEGTSETTPWMKKGKEMIGNEVTWVQREIENSQWAVEANGTEAEKIFVRLGSEVYYNSLLLWSGRALGDAYGIKTLGGGRLISAEGLSRGEAVQRGMRMLPMALAAGLDMEKKAEAEGGGIGQRILAFTTGGLAALATESVAMNEILERMALGISPKLAAEYGNRILLGKHGSGYAQFMLDAMAGLGKDMWKSAWTNSIQEVAESGLDKLALDAIMGRPVSAESWAEWMAEEAPEEAIWGGMLGTILTAGTYPSYSRTAQMMNEMIEMGGEKVTREKVGELLEIMEEEAGDPRIAKDIEESLLEMRVGDQVAEQIEQGALEPAYETRRKAEEAKGKARGTEAELDRAKKGLGKAQREYQRLQTGEGGVEGHQKRMKLLEEMERQKKKIAELEERLKIETRTAEYLEGEAGRQEGKILRELEKGAMKKIEEEGKDQGTGENEGEGELVLDGAEMPASGPEETLEDGEPRKANELQGGINTQEEIGNKSGTYITGNPANDNLYSEGGGGPKRTYSDAPLLKQTSCTTEELCGYLRSVAGDEAAEIYNRTQKWPDNIQIPKSSASLTPEGKIDWSKAPHDGYVLDEQGEPIREVYVPKKGEIIDRYGPSSGRFTSPVINGEPFRYDQRSLPYIEDQTQYHQYEVIGDFSQLDKYMKNIEDRELVCNINNYVATYYNNNWDDLIGYRGQIASINEWGIGGGIQYNLPLPLEWLEALGVIKEINKGGIR